MKKKAGNLVICIIFLAGLSLLLYPFVANQWNNYRQKQLISGYEQAVSEKEAAEGIDYDAERKKAEDYNEALLPCVLPDSFALAESSGVDPVYMNTLNIAGDEMMGSVEIPKINIKIPIYHTTEEEVLNKGAGHLEGSSLPVGGANTHAVISAHRGLPSASLFTDLDQLKEGDHFLIHVLNETLCYEVDKISVVKPEDTSALAVEDGQDLVTLLTCTPYGVNTERLLVRGHRVPYVEEEVKEEKTVLSGSSLHTNYLLWVFVGLSVTALFIFVLYLKEIKLKRRANKGGKKYIIEKEKKKKGSIVINIFIILLFIVGAGIFTYPTISNYWNEYRNAQLVTKYNESVSDLSDDQYEKLWQEAEEYNAEHKVNTIVDAFNEEDYVLSHPYDEVLDPNGDGLMGSIEIPKLNLILAIYHGLSTEVLEKGVGHVEGTSLPIGGASTHAVLAGHRGLPSAKIFTDLDQMKNGDIFLIHVLGKTLAYKVDQIKTVLPEESSELDIVEGEDHVTLVTCTPYGVNTHRLLIRGIRTEYVEPEEKAEETPIQQIAKVDPVKIMIIGLVAMVIMIIIVYIVIRRKSRKTEESSRKDE